MTLVPRSDRKRVYALLSFIPAVPFYLVLLAYMYLGNFTALVDGVLYASVYASVIGETAVLTIILTKLKVAWWLRRKRFALGRLAVVVVSMFISMITVLLLVLT